MTKICRNCDKEYEAHRKSQTYCCYRCYVEYQIKNNPDWKNKNVDQICEKWDTRWEEAPRTQKILRNIIEKGK